MIGTPPPAIESMHECFRYTESIKIKEEGREGAIVAVSAAGKDGEEPKQGNSKKISGHLLI